MEKSDFQNILNKKESKYFFVKKAILAAFFCWILITIIWFLIEGLDHWIKITGIGAKEYESTVDYVYVARNAIALFLQVNSPLIFFWLILGFYFGIKSFHQNKKIRAHFQVFIFWLFGLITSSYFWTIMGVIPEGLFWPLKTI